jgi:hypothetical protein
MDKVQKPSNSEHYTRIPSSEPLKSNSVHQHIPFKIPYVYDYTTKFCSQQAEVIQNLDDENVRNVGQGEARHRKYKRLKLDGGQAYDRSSD